MPHWEYPEDFATWKWGMQEEAKFDIPFVDFLSQHGW